MAIVLDVQVLLLLLLVGLDVRGIVWLVVIIGVVMVVLAVVLLVYYFCFCSSCTRFCGGGGGGDCCVVIMIGVVLLVLQFAVVMLRTLDVVFFKRVSFFAIGRCFRSWGMPQSCSVPIL